MRSVGNRWMYGKLGSTRVVPIKSWQSVVNVQSRHLFTWSQMSSIIVGHQTENLKSSQASSTRRTEAALWNRLISCALQHTGTIGRSRSGVDDSRDGSGARPTQMLVSLPVSR